MKNKHNFGLYKRRKALLATYVAFAMILGVSAFLVQKLSSLNNVGASGSGAINPPDQTKQTMNVLVVEINPHLRSIPGQPKVTEYVYPDETPGDHARVTVEETVADLEFSSGGYLDVNTTWEYLDEFPRYKHEITLPDGTSANHLNETNFLIATGGQSGSEGYWNVIRGDWVKQISTGDFDYSYLINKLDLVSRRNKGEFDQVWVVYVEPSGANETMMVGNKPYWINGAPLEADCENFVVAGFNVERRDSQLHALGHSYEDIMDRVYGSRFNTYGENAKDSINISTKAQYLELNLWERFTLNDYVNAGTINGIGTVHHPFNAREDYDYSNTAIVNTTYQEWGGTLSGMSGDYVGQNNAAWNSAPFNDGGPDLGSGRYYMRFWLKNFPRGTGYTSDGYLKNWWKYLFSLKHIQKATALNPEIRKGKNQEITLDYQAYYTRDQAVIESISKKYDNVIISDSNVVEVKNGKLVTKNYGQCTIKVFIEGNPLTWTIQVGKASQAVSFSQASITKAYGDPAFANTAITTGDGTITYASSDEGIAKVDSATGRVTIVGVGSVTITATAAATNDYDESSASYALVVEASPLSGNTNDDDDADNSDNAIDVSSDTNPNHQNDEQVTPSVLPDTSGAPADAEENYNKENPNTSTAKTSTTAPDTGISTKSKEGNTLSSCIAPTVIISVVFSIVLCRHKSHRKYD